MVALTPAESDAFTDFAIVFLGGSGLSALAGYVDPHLAVVTLGGSFVSAAIAGLNTWRKDSGLAPITASA